jgi:hypothetical protein
MSELVTIANAKIEAERAKLISALPTQIENLKRAEGARGNARSGHTLSEVANICSHSLGSLAEVIATQYRWAAAQSLLTTKSFVEELIHSSRTQLEPLFKSCADHIRREIAFVGVPNAERELIGRLEAKRGEVATEIELALRTTFAERKRGIVRALGSAASGWLSKLFSGGVPKP